MSEKNVIKSGICNSRQLSYRTHQRDCWNHGRADTVNLTLGIWFQGIFYHITCLATSVLSLDPWNPPYSYYPRKGHKDWWRGQLNIEVWTSNLQLSRLTWQNYILVSRTFPPIPCVWLVYTTNLQISFFQDSSYTPGTWVGRSQYPSLVHTPSCHPTTAFHPVCTVATSTCLLCFRP